jgi:hypothetical protein
VAGVRGTRLTGSVGDADGELVEGIRAVIAATGDPGRARAQQAYMKSEMPYRGIGSPELRSVLRPLLKGYVPASRESWTATVLALWDGATYREEWYAALDVDAIDAHLVAPTLIGHREAVTPVVREWMVNDHLWLRRTSVLSQLGAKNETDVVLLREAVEHHLDDGTFWLRKAIGWALRDYARTDPDWVRAEVARLGDRMSGLSRREAMKHL